MDQSLIGFSHPLQGHCLAYEHGSSACEGLEAVNPEESWAHSGDNSARPNRQHAISHSGSVTAGAADSRNLSPLSRNLAALLACLALFGRAAT